MNKEFQDGTEAQQRTDADNSTSASVEANPMLPAVFGIGEELACWIYYEDGNVYYCYGCVEKRMQEINKNKEFSDDINYENGDECGYFQDYADSDEDEPYQVTCCKCAKPLFTKGLD